MRKNKKTNMTWAGWPLSLVILLLLSFSVLAQTPQVEGSIWALTTSQKLVNFSSLAPGTINTTLTITGLQGGETLVGIDYRPRTGQLFAVSSASRIYTLNTTTGVATQVGTTTFTPAANGTAFAVDFNPVPDRIRFMSDADQNLRLHPDTGGVAGTDTTLVYATGDANVAANPNVVGAAYTNNVSGAVTTTLYGIDSNLDILVRQGSVGGAPISPNTGQLFTIGALGVNTTDQVGFDIADFNDAAFASLTISGATQSQLYSINLTTGAATAIGTIGVSEIIRDIAVALTFNPPTQTSPITVVNAANFTPGSIAADSIASVFGTFVTQNGQPATAPVNMLPTTLNGIKVSVNGVDAPLFYVSSSQLNFLTPTTTAVGVATVIVTNSDNSTRTGSVTITSAAPGLFTADASGRGSAVGFSTFDGLTRQSLTNTDGSERTVAPGTAANPNYLELFGTGFRRAVASNPTDANGVAEAVTATIQGVPATVTYAGVAPGWMGLDQINVAIPPELAGLGKLNVRLVINGQSSNVVTFTIGGTPPQVRTQSLTPGQLIVGQLTTDDQVMRAGDGSGRTYFIDAYSFTANSTSGIAVDVRSDLFDATALLYKKQTNGSLTLLAADEDLGGLGNGNIDNTNALLLTVLPGSGDYVLVVTSADDDPNALGGYTVRLRGNTIQPISYGANLTNASIATSDLQSSAGDYLDAYWFAGVQGEMVQIKMSSTNFDSFLILNGNDGEALVSDDNTGGGNDALIKTTLPRTGIYVIVATPFANNATGNYTLTLNTVTPTAAETFARNRIESLQPSRRFGRLSVEAVRSAQAESQFNRFAARHLIEK
ncbi:MAG: DUF4394 domain-containing protein [Acidobacteria bacterium]|nr:DUF4394 domain-containing protein [Acidobacteriota bacterium]